MGKKKCELCCGVARMYCESDQASLCWDCDGKVHGANFLVAKHTRCLLCSACQSHTSWKASGLNLGPTVSICESCLARKKNNSSVAGRIQNLNQEVIIGCDDGAESYDEESDEDDEEEEVENQVVPAAVGEELPVVSSSSSVSTGDGDLVVKRTRLDLDLNLSDEENESRPLKRLSRDEGLSKSTVVMNSVVKLQEGRRKSEGCCDTSSSSSFY
ncbi:B-box-type zinc finger [Arabidopsis thaliana x Arabidopsis arenosa]|uniref:B-box-type zinc finger n=1 Tax=Arabidopsis thaliana x Arabidopsis arenosa TaxID=1240361 RepID=A0A8T1XHY9_9BRAS|nr:B-box-type zinc finger [Arabidopsis thaliana x Arabidopsis arenosa]